MQTPLDFLSSERLTLVKPENRAIELAGDYLRAPKEWGSIPPKNLIELAEAILTEEKGSPGSNLQQRKIAASALTEAALPVKKYDQTIESRNQHLWLLEVVADLWSTIIEDEFTHLEKGFRRWDDQEEWLRAQLHAAHIPLYRDAVRGRTTSLARQTVVTELNRLLRYSQSQYNHRRKRGVGNSEYLSILTGFEGEIAVLLDNWRFLDNSHIIIPSTYRGGHGGHHANSTHDTLIAEVSPTEFKVKKTIEVKNKIHLPDLARYKATLAEVENDGSIWYYEPIPIT